MKDELIICECGSAEHQMVLHYDDDKDLGRQVFVEIHLVPLAWYKRLWMGIKYIFGYKCCYGNFEEMILSPKHARQVYDLYRFLNRPNLKTSETMREKDEIDQAFTDMIKKGEGDADIQQ